MVSPPKTRALTIGGFILALYGVGWYYSFTNVAPQVELIKARNDAVREWQRKRNDE